MNQTRWKNLAFLASQMSGISNTVECHHLFTEYFKKIFGADTCGIYRLRIGEQHFERIQTGADGVETAAYPIRLQLGPLVFSEQKKHIFLCGPGLPTFHYRKRSSDAMELLVTVRNGKDISVCFYAILKETPSIDDDMEQLASTFAEYFHKVDDSLRLQDALRNKHSELSERINENNDALIALNARLMKSNQELQQFAYSASHDLQEPLRNISSYINLFLRNYGNTLTEEGREFLTFATDASQRMHALIKDLLTYSRLDGQDEPMGTFEGNHMLEEAMNNLQLAVEESNALILYEDFPLLYGNEAQIVLLFQNLIDNAIKFSGKNEPVVWIEMEDKTDKWEFRIRDNGIGIAPQFQQKIFGFFTRLHAVDEVRGSGLGLSICKKIVEKHNGAITVDSNPGYGSTFTFSLSKI